MSKHVRWCVKWSYQGLSSTTLREFEQPICNVCERSNASGFFGDMIPFGTRCKNPLGKRKYDVMASRTAALRRCRGQTLSESRTRLASEQPSVIHHRRLARMMMDPWTVCACNNRDNVFLLDIVFLLPRQRKASHKS